MTSQDTVLVRGLSIKQAESYYSKYERSLGIDKQCHPFSRCHNNQSIWFFQEFEDSKFGRIKILQGIIPSPSIRILKNKNKLKSFEK